MPNEVLVISGENDLVLGRGPHIARAFTAGHYLEIAQADHFSLVRDLAAHRASAEFLTVGQ